MEEKIKQKRGGCGVGDAMKMAWDVGRVNEKFPRLLLGVMDVKLAGLIVTLGGD